MLTMTYIFFILNFIPFFHQIYISLFSHELFLVYDGCKGIMLEWKMGNLKRFRQITWKDQFS